MNFKLTKQVMLSKKSKRQGHSNNNIKYKRKWFVQNTDTGQ